MRAAPDRERTPADRGIVGLIRVDASGAPRARGLATESFPATRLPEMGGTMSELDDEGYFDVADPGMDVISGEVLDATVATLSPAEPICLRAHDTVHDAVQAMLDRRQAGVLVVDDDGHLAGIFTERDVLTRVVGGELDPRRTMLREVMTPKPEALTTEDRVAYAVYCMSVAGYRTVPLVDAEGRPVGVVTAGDVLRWLADLFPETVLNMRPGDRIKRAGEIDMG